MSGASGHYYGSALLRINVGFQGVGIRAKTHRMSSGYSALTGEMEVIDIK